MLCGDLAFSSPSTGEDRGEGGFSSPSPLNVSIRGPNYRGRSLYRPYRPPKSKNRRKRGKKSASPQEPKRNLILQPTIKSSESQKTLNYFPDSFVNLNSYQFKHDPTFFTGSAGCKAEHRAENFKNSKEDYPIKLAPRAGFEPATLRLTAGCSTIELPRSDYTKDYRELIPFRQGSHATFYFDWDDEVSVKP